MEANERRFRLILQVDALIADPEGQQEAALTLAQSAEGEGPWVPNLEWVVNLKVLGPLLEWSLAHPETGIKLLGGGSRVLEYAKDGSIDSHLILGNGPLPTADH